LLDISIGKSYGSGSFDKGCEGGDEISLDVFLGSVFDQMVYLAVEIVEKHSVNRMHKLEPQISVKTETKSTTNVHLSPKEV
jgi:hypothetical protein